MKQLVFFGTYFYPYLSGITTYPLVILSELAKEYKVTALCFKHQPDLDSQEKVQGIKVVRMPFLARLYKGFISFRSIFYFFNYAKQADVILLNQPNAEGLLLALFGKLLGKKVISIFHCQVSFDHGWLKKLAGLALNLIVFFQLALSDKIVGYTQDYVQSLFVGRFFVKKFSYTLPPVAKKQVSPSFTQELQQKKKQEVWVGFAGRISQEKGLEYLITALEKLSKESDFNFRLILAGPGEKEVVGEAKYALQIRQLLRASKIKYSFLGKLNQGELGSFYKVIDLLVIPSINQTEAFGLVQVEAMLADTPVVVSNLPGVRVPSELTNFGCVFEPGNVDQLAALIKNFKRLTKSPNRLKTAKIEKLFSKQKAAQFYENLVED